MYDFDQDDQPRQLINSQKQKLRLDYNAGGQIKGMLFPDGSGFTQGFDDRLRLTSIVDPLGGRISYTYVAGWSSPMSRLASITDARGHQTTYRYDERGNIITMWHPDGTQVFYDYDERGNQTNMVTANRRTIRSTFDSRNRPVQVASSGGYELDYAYDTLGNLVTLSRGEQATRMTYDAAGRLAKITYPNGRWLEYDYYAGGRRARMRDHTGFEMTYQYDAMGRMTRVQCGERSVVTYEYNPAGLVSRRLLGNGGFTLFDYDSLGRLRQAANYSPSTNLLSSFTYQWDERGHPVEVRTLGGTWQYGYDALGQLTNVVTATGRQITYYYDAAGNRIRSSDNGTNARSAFNARNQWISSTTHPVQYDAEGNLLQQGSSHYTYDDLGCLVAVDSESGRSLYEYDHLGKPSARTVNGQRLEYLMDAAAELGDVVAAYDSSAHLIQRYVHGNDLILSIDASGTTNWYYYDGLGNTTELTGDQGEVRNQYEYLPFGEPIKAIEAVKNPFLFGGAFGVMREPHGLYYMRARFYDAASGRFTQPDPLGFAGGLNPYTYAFNNPMNLADPSGLMPEGGSIALEHRLAGGGRPGNSSFADIWQSAKNFSVNVFNGGVNLIQRGGETAVSAIKATRQASRFVGGKIGDYILSRSSDPLSTANWLNRGITTIDYTVGFVPVFGTPYEVAAGMDKLGKGDYIGAVGRFASAIPLTKGACSVGKSIWAAGAKAGKRILGCFVKRNSERLAVKYGLKAPSVARAINRQIRICTTGTSRVVGSVDPNDITGPAGYGLQHWITGDIVLPYTIHFENVKTASAPAQIVVITNQLDAHLDWRTFELTAFGCGGRTCQIPPGLNAYHTRINLQNSLGIDVVLQASLDQDRGMATWQFKSIDPQTGLLPEDPFAGFLPPNTQAPIGEGYVSYLIRGKTNSVTGDIINALAEIVFDVNQPLATSNIFNTVDRELPISHVEPLPPESPPVFTVRWSGRDNAGIETYDIYVAKDRRPYELWRAGVTNLTASFSGDNGAAYAFFSVAVDGVGHRETAPAQPDAWTTIAAAQWLKITSTALADLVLTLAIDGLISGQSYLIERSATLRPDDWQSAGQFVATGTAVQALVTLQPGWPAMFFRVHLSAEHP